MDGDRSVARIEVADLLSGMEWAVIEPAAARADPGGGARQCTHAGSL